MKGFILITIVHILSPSWVNTLVVSKLDMNSFIDYYQKEIMLHDVEKIKELFGKQDLFKYCNRLRVANIYNAMPDFEEFSQEPSDVVSLLTKDVLQLEQDNAQMQLFNFRLGNSKETRAFFGFLCVNFEKNMSWIVSPAFVPDSAFLFEFELNFRHLSRRELQKVKEVVARSVAFVDTEGIKNFDNIDRRILKYSENPNDRDPLCDLNQVLQYRLCSLALYSHGEEEPQEDEFAAYDTSADVEYTAEKYNQYFDVNYAHDRCNKVKLLFHRDSPKKSTQRKLLLCVVNKNNDALTYLIHIGLDPLNSTNIFCTIDVGGTFTRLGITTHWILHVPLLNHIDIHKYIDTAHSQGII